MTYILLTLTLLFSFIKVPNALAENLNYIVNGVTFNLPKNLSNYVVNGVYFNLKGILFINTFLPILAIIIDLFSDRKKKKIPIEKQQHISYSHRSKYFMIYFIEIICYIAKSIILPQYFTPHIIYDVYHEIHFGIMSSSPYDGFSDLVRILAFAVYFAMIFILLKLFSGKKNPQYNEHTNLDYKEYK